MGGRGLWVPAACKVPRTQMQSKEASVCQSSTWVSVECRLVLGVSDDSLAKEGLREAAQLQMSLHLRSLSRCVSWLLAAQEPSELSLMA